MLEKTKQASNENVDAETKYLPFVKFLINATNTTETVFSLSSIFVSVDRQTISNICSALRMPDPLTQILKALYTDTYSQVRAYNSLGRKFAILSGVRQG